MGGFAYAPEICVAFPGIRGGVIHASGLGNGPSPAELTASYLRAQQQVIAAIGDTPLSDLPSIAAWRRTFTAFGVKPTQYRNAAEALLRRLTKQGDIPSINALVDMANLVSISHRVPVALFDQERVVGETTVRFARGDEVFTDLGGGQPVNPDPGEVVFVDETGRVSARRWCWRQSAESAAGPGTREVLITVEGLHDGAVAAIERAVEDFRDLLHAHQPAASLSWKILTPEDSRFEFG